MHVIKKMILKKMVFSIQKEESLRAAGPEASRQLRIAPLPRKDDLVDVGDQPLAILHIVSVFIPKFFKKHSFLNFYSVENAGNETEHDEEATETRKKQGDGRGIDKHGEINWVPYMLINAIFDEFGSSASSQNVCIIFS